MPKPVTDPSLLAILDGGGNLRAVDDPELLKQLNSGMRVAETGADVLKSGGVGLGEGGADHGEASKARNSRFGFSSGVIDKAA